MYSNDVHVFAATTNDLLQPCDTSLGSMPVGDPTTGCASVDTANQPTVEMNAIQLGIVTEISHAIKTAAPSSSDKFVRFVAEFLENHHNSRGIIPFDIRADYIEADNTPNVDRMALYILLRWTEWNSKGEHLVTVSSVVKYWTEDEGKDEGDRIALIIHYHPIFDSMDNVITDSCYQWFSCKNLIPRPGGTKSLKDLLIMGKAVSGILPLERPVQLILFHEE